VAGKLLEPEQRATFTPRWNSGIPPPGFEPGLPAPEAKDDSNSTATRWVMATGTLSGRDRCQEHSCALFVRDVIDGRRHRQDL